MSSSSKERQRNQKRAQRYALKGQLDKAIQKYQQILETGPGDKRILQKLAELQERLGDHPAAVRSWMRVGKSHARDGFPQQAVSVYKRVLKLQPDNIEARLRLAEEYANLEFNLDAVEQFVESAARLERAGKSGQLIPIYRRLVDLQPHNVDYRLRLSQLLAKANQTAAAAELLAQTALDLARARRIQEFIFWGERALRLEALNVELLNALARVYLDRDDPGQALNKLEPSLRADPYNVDTLWLLANVFHKNGQTGKVRLIHQRLSELCEQQGDPQNMRVMVERVARMLPAVEPPNRPIFTRQPARTPVADLTGADEIPEIGSAEFFMLDDQPQPSIQLSSDFLAHIPEIPPEEFVIIH